MVRMVCDADLNFTRTAENVVPLISATHLVEIGNQLDAAQEDIISKIIGNTIPASLWLIGA